MTDSNVQTIHPVLTVEELGRRVLKASGLEAAELLQLPIIDKYEIGADAWLVGESPPGNESLVIIAMFAGNQHEQDYEDHVHGDVRAYVMPRDARADDGPEKKVYRRYVINRALPAMVTMRMSLESFVDEIGSEWWDLGVRKGLVEEEEEEEKGKGGGDS